MVRAPIRRFSEDDDSINKARIEQEEYLFDGLSQYILKCYDRARVHRENHGVDTDIAYCLRAYKSAYSADEQARFGGIDVYRGITGLLCRTAESWIEDAYAMVDDKPWTLEPTPVPTLPSSIQQALTGAIQSRLAMLQQSGALIEADNQQQYDVVRALRREAELMAQEESTKALEGMSQLIQDQLLEGGWRNEFAKFRHDVMIFPTAILKYGTYRKIKKATWDGDEMLVEDEVVRVVERVSANDAYPSPDSTTTQDGEYFIERMRMSRSALIKCVGLPFFFREALRLVLYDYPEGVSDGMTGDRIAWLEGVDPNDSNIYNVYDFHGRVSGEDILGFYEAEADSELAKREDGVVETPLGDIDPFSTYEINAWLCGGKVIRMLLSPDPLELRPYAASSYCRVPGSFWGLSIALLLRSLQDEVNVAARSRAFNMGIASGPLVEIDVDRLPEDDRPEQLEPWRIFYTASATGTGHAPAVRFNQANSNVAELTAVMNEAWAKGHDIVGLPPYTYGQDQGAARTLGAFSMQYNAASKGIKRVIGNIDRDVIEEVIRSYYYYNMFNSDDPSIKADAQVVARGAIGLIRKEAREARPLETLGQVAPFLEAYPEVMEFLLREFISERGYDPAAMGMGPGRLEAGLGPSANSPVGSPDVGSVPIDGRSGPAQAAIADSVISG